MKKVKKMNLRELAKEYQLIVYWSEEDRVFLAEAPELNGCITHGKSENEAMKNGRDAILSWLEAADEFKIPTPAPTKQYSGQFVLRIGKSLHRDLVLKAQAERLSLNQFVQSLLLKAV